MEEKEVSINNLKINYKTAGSGPAVLILHGWGGSSDSWLRVQKLLAIAGFKVIIPDFPGFGKSFTPEKAWDNDDYLNWLLGFINYLNLDKFYLISHSFGGRIAIKLAVQYPEKIEGLIFCSPAGVKTELDFKTKIIFVLARIGNAIFTPKHLIRLKDAIRNIFYIFLRNKDYVKAKGNMRETIKKVLNEDSLPLLSEIKVKTLVIWGANDKMVPVKQASLYKERIKDAKLEILPGIGHSPHLEIPDKLADIIIQFLRS